MMQQLLQQNQQTALLLQQLSTDRASTRAPKVAFPDWDGKTESLPFILPVIDSYKADPYFANVVDWTTTQPGTVSRRIHDDMFAKLPQSHLHSYVNNDA